ncbi:isocitrate/isopropylmalate dehydrogenase family protein [Miniphocaeibacter halophilus]|uniref:Isocitrate/isopropylmalate dehydrogenase family protein n=1 Tax=Miniphocaeibacter halophilus TaxID=2931922 RepID=A0AC61MSF8_9FIRM|nr:isocitrate/isopropylmalate dehydrogenase family protein [Miniphocaeibacter halophilus]QQK07369.1 isocitrate/isopropylmalate dehydrogenase family protein [Miniphocaeibacter halophilus]
MHRVTMLEGDGIGVEICASLRKVFRAAEVNIQWDIYQTGEKHFEKHGELISDDCFNSLEKNKVGIKGPMTTPIGTGFRSANVFLRKKYDLFANVRPVKSLGKIDSKFENIDITIFRENTEDLYQGIEEMEDENTAKSIKIITRKGSERIAKEAFEFAKKNNIEKVTVVTKANIMKFTDGLFLEVAREVAKNYPGIKLEEVLVDNMAMQLVMYPERYKLILTENLYGDILSDLCAGLVGGLGLIPGANIGKDIAIFEPVHGSAPDIAGKNIANPTALILSGCLMLEYLGEIEAATRIKNAVDKTLSDKNNFTRDLGGNKSTEEFTDAIISNL